MTQTAQVQAQPDALRHPQVTEKWSRDAIAALFALPMNDLLFQAQTVHRANFNPNQVQVSRLLSIKTGGCPEDCKYCPQSAEYDTGVKAEKLIAVETVVAEAQKAKDEGATRYCMGAAWRSPKDRDLDDVVEIIKAVKGLGLETCATLGMLTAEQAGTLKDAGLDFYNHNIDSSEEFYGDIITTRTFQDRLDTLGHVRDAGMSVCCGGILGMGESGNDRVGMLHVLANMDEPPESVPINLLMKVEGTPLGDVEDLDPLDFVRTIAVARTIMPQSHVRLSAGRENMSDEMQALCFFAGANSIFSGDKLLTAGNPGDAKDHELFARLGLEPEPLGR
ncbi:MAG: biotin synthase BioB [Rhodospirillales bacterium]|nr:biotin synthase BioB [Rhodospirillales bacterium]